MSSEVLKERSRVSEILSIGQEFGLEAQAREAVQDGQSIQDFQNQVLQAVKNTVTPAPGFRVEAGLTEEEKFRAAAIESIHIRGGLTEPNEDNNLASMTLRELARECMFRSGQSRRGSSLTNLIGRALTTSDFPHILSGSANKSLIMGFDQAEETWAQWCGTGVANDFKTHHLVRPSEISDLAEVPEHAEYKHGTRSESQEKFQIATYGQIFAITRQAIINDDFQILTDIPLAHGEAAARKIGDVAYTCLIGNELMGDGKALFHEDHANQAETGGAVSVTTIAAGVAAMRKQKDILSQRSLNIRPRFFIAPVALEGSAEQFFLSHLEGTQQAPGKANPYSGSYFVRVFDPRLDDDSATAWYLAGPKGKTVNVYFLDGHQKPYLETREGWNVDGTEFKVRIDCAAKAIDWRGLYINSGSE